jgi:hypothetical protein
VKERWQGRDRNDNTTHKSKGLRLRYKRMKESKYAWRVRAKFRRNGNFLENKPVHIKSKICI